MVPISCASNEVYAYLSAMFPTGPFDPSILPVVRNGVVLEWLVGKRDEEKRACQWVGG